MIQQFVLDKWVWTQDDFAEMGWHDCPIYAMRFEDNVYLDIDYIFKWNDNGPGNPFTYWIAPVTLMFENPFYLKTDFELDFINGIEIADIFKEKSETEATIWRITTFQGSILVGADSYKQIVRRAPSFQFMQSIPLEERDGISFSTISDKLYIDSPVLKKKKLINLRLYALANEKRELTNKLENGYLDKMETKKRIIEKNKIEKKISSINQKLSGTIFKSY